MQHAAFGCCRIYTGARLSMGARLMAGALEQKEC